MPIENVLVAVDFSEASRAALRYAAVLAARLGATLSVLYVSPRHASYEQLPAFPAQPALDPLQRQQLEDDLRGFAASAGAPPADEILAALPGSAFDLLVLGTHGRRGFERWHLGSVVDRVVRRVDRPLLAVPPDAVPPDSPRVLCAVDLSDSTGPTLEAAALLARALDSHLVVLHVAEGMHWYEPWPVSGVDPDAIRAAVTDTARARLSALAEKHLGGAAAEVRVAFGRPQREIEREAGEAGLVVLGAASRHGIDRVFFGSTAQHVLRAAVSPVLLVRHAAAPNDERPA